MFIEFLHFVEFYYTFFAFYFLSLSSRLRVQTGSTCKRLLNIRLPHFPNGVILKSLFMSDVFSRKIHPRNSTVFITHQQRDYKRRMRSKWRLVFMKRNLSRELTRFEDAEIKHECLVLKRHLRRMQHPEISTFVMKSESLLIKENNNFQFFNFVTLSSVNTAVTKSLR